MKTVQYFTAEYLDHCRKLSPNQIVKFLEDYRTLQQEEGPAKLISIRIPTRLLEALKHRSAADGIKYQTKIKELIREYLR